jgi:hypothetical protein
MAGGGGGDPQYGPGHEVTRFVDLAAAEILTAAVRMEMTLVSGAG